MLENVIEAHQLEKRERANLWFASLLVCALLLVTTFFHEASRYYSLSILYGRIAPIVSALHFLVFALAIICLKKGIAISKIKKTINAFIPIVISILLIVRHIYGHVGGLLYSL